MTQYSLLIDLDRCIGCHSCTVSCKVENNIDLGNYWNQVYTVGPTGKFPVVQMYFLAVPCQHCENPACVAACPTGASHKEANGIVLVDKDKCIGCRYCTMACPYGVRAFNVEEKVVEKCTLCEHLISAGDLPACVKACPGKARTFGDIADPNSDISKKIKAAGDKVFSIRPDLGTKPSVRYILRKQTWRA